MLEMKPQTLLMITSMSFLSGLRRIPVTVQVHVAVNPGREQK
jgi:hypothetical protein